MSIPGEGYEPPETTGGEADGPGEDEGVCDGCCSPLPELALLFELDMAELEEDGDLLAELAADAGCP